MESNPAYGFAQQNTASETPTADNTYELVDLPATSEKCTDKKNNAGDHDIPVVDKKPQRRPSVGVLAAILAVLALVVAITAIVVLNQTDISNQHRQVQDINTIREMLNQTGDNSNQEIQSIQLEIANLREMLNQTRDNPNQENQSLKLDIATLREMRNQTRDNSYHEIQSLQLKIENLREMLNFFQGRLLNHLNYTGIFFNPATSCSDISQDNPSGDYWIQTDRVNSPVQVYCDMTRTCCSTAGGWTRVANLDMTDPSQQCPDGFRQVTRTTAPLRTCGRPGSGCVSSTFPVHGIEYSQVCGRVIGYHFSSPNAFHNSQSIDDIYADGVSLTHGQSPRQHIWTFAAALGETYSFTGYLCPCTRPSDTYVGTIPSFVGNDYFCDTAERGSHQAIFYPDDPLWDGQGCGGTSTCCSFNNPPWFCKQLPQPTTDDIELRLCGKFGIHNQDTPLEIVEVYVK